MPPKKPDPKAKKEEKVTDKNKFNFFIGRR